MRDYLTRLAVRKNVAASTQNVAFNALLFMFQSVSEQPFPDISDVVRAHRPRRMSAPDACAGCLRRMPAVLTKTETARLLCHLEGPLHLFCSLLYGAGPRLCEGQRLRVKDLDFERATLIVHEGKGDKDRVVPLPRATMPALQRHLEMRRLLNYTGLPG